ncbi:MAG TPA: DUF5723 family protein [Bacteroidales bacterium]|nr:DUF5723 family protein [Bacteroidales bacterium]HPS62776.1 DUF5723 family protein [Bacteroidales bacterium]
MRRYLTPVWVLGCLLMQAVSPLQAQHDLGLYNMKMIPQRMFQNPAFIPQQKFYLGLPVLSGLQSSFSVPFSYNDLIERDAYDSVTFRVGNFLKKLGNYDRFRLYTDVDVLTLGTRIANGKFYLGLSIRERISQHIRIPENLGNLLWYGNAAPQLFGRYANIAPSVNFTAFDEWGASLSGYAMKDRITWGVRLKYLSGRFDASTIRSRFDVYTDTSNYHLFMQSDFEFRTSGIDDIDTYLDQPAGRLVFPGNHGVGIDVGATFRVNDHLELNASLLDLGFIRWKSRTMNIISHHPGEIFEFDGFSLQDFIDMLSNINLVGQKITDSVVDLVEIDTVYSSPYTSWLPTRYNLGGTWSFNEHHHLNLLLNGVSWHGRLSPGLSASWYYELPKILGLMVSYNVYDRRFTNVGFGLSVHAGPIQLYALTDNLTGLIFYHRTRGYSFHVGLTIAIHDKEGSAPAPTRAPDPEATPK